MAALEGKRACWPSFFMGIAVLLVLLLSIFIYDYVYWFVSVSIIFLLALYFFQKKIVLNPLSIFVTIFVILLILNNEFIRPIFNSEATYLLSLFAGSFILFSHADKNFLRHIIFFLVGVFLLLSIWGAVQYTTGYGVLISMGGRANSIFVTPNTFAAAINSILLPLIVFFLFGKNRQYLLATILILFAAFLITKSRGGWGALFYSLIFIALLLKVLKISVSRKRINKLLLGMLLVFTTYSGVDLVEYDRYKGDFSFSDNYGQLIRYDGSGTISRGMSARFLLYDVAWQLLKQKPFFGHGFHTYQYYQLRDHKSYIVVGQSRMAHNDYLQLGMELGLLGPLLLIMLFITPVFFLWNHRSIISNEDRMYMLALIASLASLYAHALVDFIIYVPFLLLMIALNLGICNQLVNKYFGNTKVIDFPDKYIRLKLVKSLAGVLMLCILAQPAIAQTAYKKAMVEAKKMKFQSAIRYFGIARRFASYEPLYYWHEGAILVTAIKVEPNRELARRADKLFSVGMSKSPFYVRNKLAGAELHREYGHLIPKPEDLEVVLSWLEHAIYWRPYDPVVQSEYLKILLEKEEYEKARNLLRIYVLQDKSHKIIFEENKIYEKLQNTAL